MSVGWLCLLMSLSGVLLALHQASTYPDQSWRQALSVGIACALLVFAGFWIGVLT